MALRGRLTERYENDGTGPSAPLKAEHNEIARASFGPQLTR